MSVTIDANDKEIKPDYHSANQLGQSPCWHNGRVRRRAELIF